MMSDANDSPRERDQPYPMEPNAASRALQRKLLARIGEEGPLPFSTFMQAALYHPELGYYAAGGREIGRGGDFFTSVSVGPCFGALLARRFEACWRAMGSPDRFDVVEAGAHDGRLAFDLLDAAAELTAKFQGALRYHLIEPLAALARRQRERLAPFSPICSWHSDWDSLDPVRGVIFSNEVPDAFPVDLLIKARGQWMERRVGRDDSGQLVFTDQAISEGEHEKLCRTLDSSLPDGYQVEFSPGLEPWSLQVGKVLEKGLWLTIDYGHLAEDLYHPARREGTIRGYLRHKQTHELLAHPGNQDLTADVNFTRLAELGRRAGLRLNGFADQARYLTAVARDWLLEIERRPSPASTSLVRQFRTLTHPGHLGQRFQALEMASPDFQEPSPFAFAPVRDI